MIEDIIKSLKPFQEFFATVVLPTNGRTDKFRQQDQEDTEILLMLACGHIFEIFTPNQLAQILGIDKGQHIH